jgi:polar amino acid transport system substrate-binding protein
MDATVQDGPCATHFVNEYPDLHQVALSETPGFYVIYYRKTDTQLGEAINRAIADGLQDGTLERIYRKHNIWTDDQAQLAAWQTKPWPPPLEADATNSWPRLVRELLAAAGMTIFLSLASFPLAVIIGLTIAIGRIYGPRLIRIMCGLYVEVIRGTPLLLQLFVIYYVVPDIFRGWGLPQVGLWLTPLVAGILGLAINYSAYEAENYRAGLLAIPAGQLEAALALGMTRRTALRRILVPQAIRIVIPPVTNDFIALFKDTSACSILFVTELTRKYNELFNFNRDLVIELAFLTAGLYLMMSYPLSLAAGYLERRLAGSKGGAA